MNKIAYFQCPTGVAGDMCLGTLVSLGVPVEYLVEKLNKNKAQIAVFDPVAEPNAIVNINSLSNNHQYHLIIKATNHQIFENLNYPDFALPNALLFNISTFSFSSLR
jgi:hypothetical protein